MLELVKTRPSVRHDCRVSSHCTRFAIVAELDALHQAAIAALGDLAEGVEIDWSWVLDD
jgi:hypothetical protein